MKLTSWSNFLIVIIATIFAVVFSLILVHYQMIFFWDTQDKDMGYWLGFWTPLVDGILVATLAVYFKHVNLIKVEKERDIAQKYLDLAGNMIINLDSNGDVLLINDEGCRILEANKDEIIGLNWFENFITPDKKESIKEIFSQLMRSNVENVKHLEEYVVTKKGNRRLIFWENTLMYDEDGEITGTLSSGRDITKEKELIDELMDNRQRFSDIFYSSPVGIFYFDASWVIKEVNESFANILGTSPENLQQFNMKQNLINKELIEAIDTMFKTGSGEFKDYYTSISSGKTRYVSLILRCIKDDNGKITGGVGIAEDLTDKYQLELKLNEQHKHLQNVIDGMHEAMTVIDKDYNILLMNKSAKSMLNEKYVVDMQHPKCYELSHHSSEACDSLNHPCPLTEALETKSTQKALHKHYDSDDKECLVEVTISPLLDENDEVYAFVESGHDVTDLLQMKEELNKHINYDVLTGLPNRTLYMDLLKEYIKHAKRSKSRAAVILIDLDNFKTINDSFGHQEGDKVIIEFSKLIEKITRDEDTIARFGGDSYSILLENIEDELAPVRILENLKNALSEMDLKVSQQQVNLTFSAGISIYPQDGETPEDLFKNADAAMYEAKEMGRDTYKYYTNELTQKAFERIVMDSNLRDAYKNEEFLLYYQPQYNTVDDKLIGMEALIRWNHSSMGIIPPNKFIGILESSSLIIQVGEWVMKTAFEAAVKWRNNGFEPGIISVNLSIVQLNCGDKLLEQISNLLESTKCKAEWIGIEITESMMMKDTDKAIELLTSLKKLGFKISIDDFGTGYSSLTYLKKMPIDKLKIDQSFIKDLPDDKDDAELTRTIISLAKNLRLDIIAEGVETIAQKDFLIQHGCKEVQGYLYEKPMPYELITEHLKQKIS